MTPAFARAMERRSLFRRVPRGYASSRALPQLASRKTREQAGEPLAATMIPIVRCAQVLNIGPPDPDQGAADIHHMNGHPAPNVTATIIMRDGRTFHGDKARYLPGYVACEARACRQTPAVPIARGPGWGRHRRFGRFNFYRHQSATAGALECTVRGSNTESLPGRGER
jgi:hypothetical protein